MKAVRQLQTHGALSVQEIGAPVPGDGDVLVGIEAAGVLSYHNQVLQGELGYPMPKAPFTPGNDGIGTVLAVGRNVMHAQPGDRVAIDPRLFARENVSEPEGMLLALIGLTPGASRLQDLWPDGTWAEQIVVPVELITVLPDLPGHDGLSLSRLHKFAVCYGGLVRGRLSGGETVAVLGATGNFGAPAVPLALAMGASRVVAIGRNEEVLASLAAVNPRVSTVALSGDEAVDAAALRTLVPGGVDIGLDLIGHGQDSRAIGALLTGIREEGRLVLQGSMDVPLELPYGSIMRRNIDMLGAFMYPRDTFSRLSALVASGQLDLDCVSLESFPFTQFEQALQRASEIKGLGHVVMVPDA